jgi:hypothetical protein
MKRVSAAGKQHTSVQRTFGCPRIFFDLPVHTSQTRRLLSRANQTLALPRFDSNIAN